MNLPICSMAEATCPIPREFGAAWQLTLRLVCIGMLVAATAHGQVAAPLYVPASPKKESAAQTVIDLRTAMALAEQRAPELLEPAAERRAVPAVRAAADRVVHRPPRAVMSLGPRRLSGGAQLGWDVTAGVYQEFSLGGYGRRLGSYASALEERANAN